MRDDDMAGKLRKSGQEQEALRAVARWAAEEAGRALPVFERRHPGDARPREAIGAGRAFGDGARRDQGLRRVAMEAFRAVAGADVPSAHAARAASLVAAVAYTHTDLHAGEQGVRQARHLLGPAVYAALALEAEAGGEWTVGEAALRRALDRAPAEARRLLAHFPRQPGGADRVEALFAALDAGLRSSSGIGVLPFVG